MSSPSVKIAISPSELTLAVAGAQVRVPSASDSTMMPLRLCATNLNNPP